MSDTSEDHDELTYERARELAGTMKDEEEVHRFLALWHAREQLRLEMVDKRQPSKGGRWFRPAKTERKLVLFTLGIIVGLAIVTIAAVELWGPSGSDAITPLVGLAGTGIGFIGGMVSSEQQPPGRR